MGASAKERRAVRVDESTWRKARILAAAFGVPIYDIVTRAINEMAKRYSQRIEEVMVDDDVPREGKSNRDR